MTPANTHTYASSPQRPRRPLAPSRPRTTRLANRTFATPVVRELPPRRERRTNDW